MAESKVVYDFNPYNLPPEYQRAVGLVALASAQTESVLRDLIGALLGIDNIQTLALTTHMSIPLKDDIIRTLAELDTPNIEAMDELDDLLDAARAALSKRNIIVHNPYAINPDTGEILGYRLKARGSLQLELEPVTVEQIEQEAALIYKVGMDIVGFMMDRDIKPRGRTKPIPPVINRGKKARSKRRNI